MEYPLDETTCQDSGKGFMTDEAQSALHPDARQIVKLMVELDVSLADIDWKQLVDWIDAAVRHANETGYRRGLRAKRGKR